MRTEKNLGYTKKIEGKKTVPGKAETPFTKEDIPNLKNRAVITLSNLVETGKINNRQKNYVLDQLNNLPYAKARNIADSKAFETSMLNSALQAKEILAKQDKLESKKLQLKAAIEKERIEDEIAKARREINDEEEGSMPINPQEIESPGAISARKIQTGKPVGKVQVARIEKPGWWDKVKNIFKKAA